MDAKTLCNLGLAKLGSNRVTTLDPAKSPLEIHCAEGYPHWIKSELSKHRWGFSRTFITLTQIATVPTTAERPYVYSLPDKFIRAVRYKNDEWQRRGNYIHSAKSDLTIEAHIQPIEDIFDPLFVDVVAVRVAMECVEKVTQSNTKTVNLSQMYKDAENVAARMNAFEIGSEDIQTEDEDSEWLQARLGVGL